MSGQRLLSKRMMALSMLKLSFGSLSMTQPRILTGSPSVVSSRKLSLKGIFLAPKSLDHCNIACSRYKEVKAPMYAISPAERVISPTHNGTPFHLGIASARQNVEHVRNAIDSQHQLGAANSFGFARAFRLTCSCLFTE